jgi:hypothetical protein
MNPDLGHHQNTRKPPLPKPHLSHQITKTCDASQTQKNSEKHTNIPAFFFLSSGKTLLSVFSSVSSSMEQGLSFPSSSSTLFPSLFQFISLRSLRFRSMRMSKCSRSPSL